MDLPLPDCYFSMSALAELTIGRPLTDGERVLMQLAFAEGARWQHEEIDSNMSAILGATA